MTFDLKEKLNTFFTRQLSETLAQQSEENIHALEKAFHYSSVISAVLLFNKMQYKEKAKAFYVLSRVAFGANLAHALPHMFHVTGHYRGLVNMGNVLYGDQLKPLHQWLAKETGVSEEHAASIMKMSAPVVLSVFGEKIKSRRLAVQGYYDYIKLQEQEILALANEIPLFPFYIINEFSKKNEGSSTKRKHTSSQKNVSRPWYLSWKMKWSMMLLFSVLVLFYWINK